MNGNAFGMALGDAINTGWKAYAWMKGLEDQQRQDAARIQAGQDKQLLDAMIAEDQQRAEDAARRQAIKEANDAKLKTDAEKQAAADAAFETSVATMTPEQASRARALRGAKLGGVDLGANFFSSAAETPEQKSARELTDYENRKKIDRKYEKPKAEVAPKPEKVTLAQKNQAERWKQGELSKWEAAFAEGKGTVITPERLEQEKARIQASYLAQIGAPAEMPEVPMVPGKPNLAGTLFKAHNTGPIPSTLPNPIAAPSQTEPMSGRATMSGPRGLPAAPSMPEAPAAVPTPPDVSSALKGQKPGRYTLDDGTSWVVRADGSIWKG